MCNDSEHTIVFLYRTSNPPVSNKSSINTDKLLKAKHVHSSQFTLRHVTTCTAICFNQYVAYNIATISLTLAYSFLILTRLGRVRKSKILNYYYCSTANNKGAGI